MKGVVGGRKDGAEDGSGVDRDNGEDEVGSAVVDALRAAEERICREFLWRESNVTRAVESLLSELRMMLSERGASSSAADASHAGKGTRYVEKSPIPHRKEPYIPRKRTY